MPGRQSDLVSVIVPAYNAATHLRETLESALAQTYSDIEVIVVDDGSTDETLEVAGAIAATDPRVRVLRQANKGPGAARNLGIEQARGTLIAPLDADDLWHPTKIAKQVSVMRQAGLEVGLVYTWSAVIDEDGCIVDRSWGESVKGDAYAALVLYNFLLNGSTPLVRRRCLAETGGYDEAFRYAQDYLFSLSIAERYDFAVVPEFLVGYRRTPGSWSGNLVGLTDFHGRVLAEARRRHPELPARLFRWSMAASCFPAAGKSLRRGRLLQGLSLLARSMLLDPALLLTPMARRRPRREPGVRFTDALPESQVPPHSRPFGHRRHAYVERLRIDRPAWETRS